MFLRNLLKSNPQCKNNKMEKKTSIIAFPGAIVCGIYMAYLWHTGHQSLPIGVITFVLLVVGFRQAKELGY